MQNMTSKTCSKCKAEKPISEFSRAQAYSDGYRGQCKPCRRSYNRSYRQRPEFTRSKYIHAPEKSRKYFLKRKYKKDVEWFQRQTELQNGRCAICQCEAENAPHGKLCIDHCHKTGTVRGLICMNCNTGIGFLADSPERVESALRYLRSFLEQNEHPKS